MTTTVLFDADILAFQAAAVHQSEYDWGDGEVGSSADEEGARDFLRHKIDTIMAILDADHAVVCLTDSEDNFRFDFFPTYKSNRDYTNHLLRVL